MSIDYTTAGVNVDVGNAVARSYAPLAKTTHDRNVLPHQNGFAAAYQLPTDSQTILLAATDGVGTKLLLANQLQHHTTIGIDLVAMVANDLLADGAQPLFFLDYMATDHLVPEVAQDVMQGIVAGCQQAGMSLIGGETAEMPDMYPAGHYDLAGFALGMAQRDQLLPQEVAISDTLVGLPSSGLHSNGFSLVRRLLAIDDLETQPLADGQTIAQAALTPTRIYVSAVLPLIQRHLIHGIAHITGGGFTDNVPRMLPAGMAAQLQPWAYPELFARLQTAGELSDAEMRRTFNLGFGMILAVGDKQLPDVLAALPDAQVLGQVIERQSDAPEVQWEGDA
ncbi:phosphoribosylformylglycinamidine cyclo-ligase [Lacticaseibacillus saniviri]